MRKSLTLALAACLASAAASAQGVIATLSSYEGQVDVIRNGIPLAQYPDLPMLSGDLVHAHDGRATVRFIDGSEMRVGPSSRLELTDDQTTRTLDVFFGTVWLQVPAGQRPTQLKTGEVLVRLTAGAIEYVAEDDGGISVGVSSGDASVTQLTGSRPTTVRLLADQQTRIPASGPIVLPRPFAPGSLFTGAPVATGIPPAPAQPPAEPEPTAAPEAMVAAGDAPTTAAAATHAPPDLSGVSDLDSAGLDDLGLDDLGGGLDDLSTGTASPVAPRQTLTQGQYGTQLAYDLGIASYLPDNATTADVLAYLTSLHIEPCRAGTIDRSKDAPVVPCLTTGDLHVLDSGSGHILRLDNKGGVSVAVHKDEILAATTADDVNFAGKALAFDLAGDAFFTEEQSHSILKHDGATVGQLVTADALTAAVGSADPDGLTFGGRNRQFSLIATSDSLTTPGLLTIDLASGAVTRVDVTTTDLTAMSSVLLGSGIVGDSASIFALSRATPNGVVGIPIGGGPVSVVATGAEIAALGPFTTRRKTGELVVTDSTTNNIYEIGTGGVVTQLVAANTLELVTKGRVDLGAMAFSQTDELFVVDRASNSVLRYRPNDGKASTFTSAERIQKKTSVMPRLDGGIAFAYMDVGGWVADRKLELADSLCLAGFNPNDPNAPITISTKEMIERILTDNADLFWLQVRRKQSTSPFAP